MGQLMTEDRNLKSTCLGWPTGRIPVCRPRNRWSDAVEADMRKLQANNWRKTAQERRKWRNLVSEDKTSFGSLSQRSKC